MGGSWAFIAIAVGFLLTGFFLLKRSSLALWIYALVILGALGWAIYEVGFDWWRLGSTGGIIVLLGLWLLTPWVRKPLNGGGLPLTIATLAALVVAGYSMTQDPTSINGNLPTEKVAATPDLGGNVPDGEWHQYGRTPYGQRYSPLAQITPENVSKLQVAWQYQTGDVKQPEDVGETTYQVTPLKIGDSLFLCTPHNWAIALDAATGKEKWKFDPKVGFNTDRQHQTCRGVSYWKDSTATAGAKCSERVYLPTSDARLIALDTQSGEICTDFANGGTLDLSHGMKYNPAGYYYSTSPPAVVVTRSLSAVPSMIITRLKNSLASFAPSISVPESCCGTGIREIPMSPHLCRKASTIRPFSEQLVGIKC